MLRKMFQGGSSRKQGPRLAMRDADEEPPKDAPVRPCEWPSENFMDRAGIKDVLLCSSVRIIAISIIQYDLITVWNDLF